jgi:uncharacterized protein (DUF1684 family)
MTRILLACGLSIGLLAAAGSYEASIDAWRAERESNLKKPDGWLTVAGLFWLNEGENRIGTQPKDEIALPPGRAPQRVGTINFRDGKATFRAAPGVAARVNGQADSPVELKSDASGKPDLIQTGDFTMFVIKRGDRYAVRLRDLHSKMREEFSGLHWYPVREDYRVVAKFTTYPDPQKIAIPNILGQTEMEPSPGYATFQLAGQTIRLDPVLEGDQLFFIFRDQTSGKSTYGAGRFLYADLPKDGKVVLDFNKAYNPPCAFTPYATCPLPPKQNRMAIKVEAGELKYGEH